MKIVNNFNKVGLSSIKDQIIIPTDYENIKSLVTDFYQGWNDADSDDTINDGHHYFRVSKDGHWGVIDIHQNTILPFEYEAIGRFAFSGHYIVQKQEKWGVVNAKNEILLPFHYDGLGDYFVGDGIIANKDDLYGIIRMDETEIVPFIYRGIEYQMFNPQNMQVPNWQLYRLTKGVSKYDILTFAADYKPLDLSCYRMAGLMGGTFAHGNSSYFTVKSCNNDFYFNVDNDGLEWEDIRWGNRSAIVKTPLANENSYQYALSELRTRLEQKQTVDAKYIKSLFAKVYTWTPDYWTYLEPYIDNTNYRIVEFILETGLKKAAHKEEIACGQKRFYEAGLRFVHRICQTFGTTKIPHEETPYGQLYNRLLAVVEKSAGKTILLKDCVI